MHMHHKEILDSKKKKAQTFWAENTLGGTVKERRVGPPRKICFLTVHNICKEINNTMQSNLQHHTSNF